MSPFSLGFCYSLFETGVHAHHFRFQKCERIEGHRWERMMAGPASGRE